MTGAASRLGAFKITVADANASQRFYEAAFGMVAGEPIVADGFREHILKTPGQEFALVLYQKDGLEVVRGNSYGPICFYVSDIDAALSRAEAAGGKSTGPVQSFGPVKYVFLETPDGHVVELIERPD
ncbi:MAG: VOC family protein [Novosphingobium sp.]|nr:VOC family protein [Novosphingobium sp.]